MTNLQKPYFVARVCLPLMLKGGDKTLVLIVNDAAHSVSTRGWSA